jgi:hypothetical protein
MLETMKLALNLFITRFFRVMSIVLCIVAVFALGSGDFVTTGIALLFGFFAVCIEVQSNTSPDIVESDE